MNEEDSILNSIKEELIKELNTDNLNKEKDKVMKKSIDDILSSFSYDPNDEEIRFWNNIKPVGREYW